MAQNIDYIPHSDEDFNTWQKALLLEVVANGVSIWNIPGTAVTDLQVIQTIWQDAWSAARVKQNRTSAQVQAKNDARDQYEPVLRQFVKQWLAYNTSVTDTQRVQMGLTVKDTTPTHAPIPDYAPVLSIDELGHLFHFIRFADPRNPHTQKKPDGVASVEVWFALTVAPATPSFALHGSAGRFLYRVSFPDADVTKTASYKARYVNTRGEKGPWSNVISAVVA